MTTKNVYTFRINKSDTDIKEYLDQFPISDQRTAIKKLLKYGIESLKRDYQEDQLVQSLKSDMQKMRQEQDEKLNKIIQLLSNSNIQLSDKQEQLQEHSSINVDKAKNTMEEALSMFMT